MKTFDICLRVPQDQLTVVLGALSDPCEIIKIEPTSPGAVAAVAPNTGQRRQFSYANGKHDKGITGEALVLEVLARGPTTRDGMVKAFTARGFSDKSASPIMSKLRAAGRITISNDGVISRSPS